MLVGDIPENQLARRLRGTGINLSTGALTVRIRSNIQTFVDEFTGIYGGYPIEDPPGIDDGCIDIAFSSRWRRYFRPKAQAYLDGCTYFQPLPGRLAFPMLESMLNWCLAISDCPNLLLHAGVVERDGHALILPAESGSGKSTLCAALVARGWRLLSDEFAIIGARDGRALPNPRPVSLKNESIDVIGEFAPDARLSRRYPGTPKGTVAFMRAPSDAVARVAETAQPALVLLPAFSPRSPVELDTVDKTQGFKWLTDQSVNYHALLEVGFNTLADLVDRCPIYHLSYSRLDEVIERIERLHHDAVAAVRAA